MHNILTCAEDAAVFNIDIREAKAKKSLVVVEKGEKVPLYSIMSNPQKATQFVVAGYDRFVRFVLLLLESPSFLIKISTRFCTGFSLAVCMIFAF
jgi:hypothetical protein